MNQKLNNLRQKLSENNWDAIIIPCADPHMSEYIPERWKCLSWISGFTGSAGNGIVTKDFAGVWTDSRYFIQAEEQMKDTGFQLVKLKVQHAPEYVKWLEETLPENSTIAIVGSTMGITVYRLIQEIAKQKGIRVVIVEDFWDEIWLDRPAIPANEIVEHNVVFAGKSRSEKIGEVRTEIRKAECDAHFISTLDDIAWTLNLRGSDTKYNPVFLAHLYIDFNQTILFANLACISATLEEKLESEGVVLSDYTSLPSFCSIMENGKTILIDERKTTVQLLNALPIGSKIVNQVNPSIGLKAIKNPTELENFRTTMVKDGVTFVKFLIWLENAIGKEKITEQTMVDKILEYRQIHPEFVEPSFSTIAGYKEHSALPHYSPIPETDFEIQPEGLFLLDSGGQFLGGTTDITRVFSMGKITEEERTDYTTVLKSLIALSSVQFPKGTSAISLDVIARRPIWDAGKHYAHGTGHGVGYFLNVHEGPQAFGTGANAILTTSMEEGMVTTIEPGIYNRGRYGVRLENMIITVPSQIVNDLEFLRFETITLCPFERELINEALLSPQEIDWLNDYHEMVYVRLFTSLNKEEFTWLKERTKKIESSFREEQEYLIRG